LTLPLLTNRLGLQKILVTPLPRYLNSGCCNNSTHATNVGTPEYSPKITETLVDYRRWCREFLHKQKICGVRVVLPGDLAGLTKNGAPLEGSENQWETNGVHLNSGAYRKLAAGLAKVIKGQLEQPGAAPRAVRRHTAETESLTQLSKRQQERE